MIKREVSLRFEGLGFGCDDPVAELSEALREPAPGVDGIDARVVSATIDGEDIVAVVELEPVDYLRQAFALGEEPLQILSDLQSGGLPAADLGELVEFIRSEPEMSVAVIDSGGGSFNVDNYPKRPSI